MAPSTDIDDLRAAWRALSGSREGEGWKTIQVRTAAPCLLLAGRRLPGDEEAILVGFSHVRAIPASHLPQGQGFEISLLAADLAGDDQFWLALARRPGGSLELFVMMAQDLVRLLDSSPVQDSDRLLDQFLFRIRAWQDFMDRHRDGVLSPEAELGLFGELVLVSRMIDLGMPAANVLDAWRGPLDSPQDFMLGGGAIEVKTTLSAGGFPAIITSLEQLDDSLCRPLFLAAVRLALDPSGASLPARAGALREQMGEDRRALDLFELRLMQAGLLFTTAERYSRRYRHVSTFIMQVGERFPRLTRAQIHPAIRKARYEIDLELVGASDVGLAGALELLGAA
jgi:hypothetical protein